MRKSRTGVGLQMALALLLPGKGRAAAPDQPTQPDLNSDDDGRMMPSPSAPDLTGRWDFSRLFAVETAPEIVEEASQSAEKVQHLAHHAWRMTRKMARSASEVAQAETADAGTFTPAPMSHEEIRLWLQSFNAGPYALLKYQGDVPYKETRDYVPRVLKYYEQDLSSEYDPIINQAAAKYGLDPQMIRAIMKTESDFKKDCVSHAGARGLLQVMPVVWKEIKGKYDLEWDYNSDVFEPAKNVEVGCAYLAWLRYDFLPRHFAAYDRNPDAPSVLVRDHDRGVPDRETPRLVAKSDNSTPQPDAVEVASVSTDVRQAEKSAAPAPKSSEEPAAKAPEKTSSRVIVTDVAPGKTEKTEGGKTRVVMRGTGKAVAISVDKSGKVVAKAKPQAKPAPTTKAGRIAAEKKATAMAKSASRADRDEQGG